MKLIVLVLAVVVVGIGWMAIRNIQADRVLGAAAEDLVTILKQAQIYAKESKGKAEWGVICKDAASYVMVSRSEGKVVREADFGLNPPVRFADKCGWGQVWFASGSGEIKDTLELKLTGAGEKYVSVKIWNNGVILLQPK